MAKTIKPQSARVRPGTAPSGIVTTSMLVRRYLGDISWAARIAAGAVVLISARTWPAFRHELSFLVILAILTLPVRSVRWGTVYNFFLLGFLFAFVIVGAQYLIEKVMLGGHYPNLGGLLIAPVTEEPGKISPLVILLLLGWWGLRNSRGACDLMLCGAALGGGFGFLEHGARMNQSFPHPTSPVLFGVAIFPDSYGGFIGHGASTAFIALMLGYLLYAIRWRRWMLPGLVGALAVLFWMMVDHGLSNYSVGTNYLGWVFPIRWIWAADGNGGLSPYFFFALILVTIAAERLVLWRILRGSPRLSPGICFAHLKRPLQQGWGYPQLRAIVKRAQALVLYMFSCRRLAFLKAHYMGDVPANKAAFASLITKYMGQVAIAQIAVRDL
jgi:RsiW-degrading membrane proteinase PrsW (M82 family)